MKTTMNFKKGLALSKSKGFTLIELLVVIGVLGILAAGLLATVDPLEQFRKGNDSNKRSTSVETVNAISRYNAVKQVMPWATIPLGGAGCAVPPVVGGVGTQVNVWTCIASLVTAGEVKASFPNSRALQSLFVAADATGLRVCFLPESKALKGNVNETKYLQGGGACTTFGANPETTNTCYWCAQ